MDIKVNTNVQTEATEKRVDGKRIFSKYLIVFILLAMVAGITAVNPRFLAVGNLLNLLTQTSIYGVLALGMLLVIISKGIDLSVGSVLAFAGIVAGSISQVADAPGKLFPGLGQAPLWMTILVALSIGALLGLINGALIAYAKVPAFIATLGMFTAARGGALMFSDGRPVSNVNPEVTIFGTRLFGWLPVPVLIYGGVILLTFVLLRYTSFGKSVFAIGGNMEAAKVSGIKVKRNLTLIYMYSGLLAGLAALIYMGRTGGSVQPAAATGYELTAVAAATIGGASHAGGVGTVWGAVVGALILGVLTNGFTLLGIDAYVQQIVQGIIIVAAVVMDMRKNKTA
ncbi:ABC transporter permease [Atopococcus tabaci]|uniref:ABC transporter permease n=1 Tax=Atopococcus tabaci TaxID=269774 RepID=UPI00040796F7|nr:ABC transporter permease [Atopococcus tabaci]